MYKCAYCKTSHYNAEFVATVETMAIVDAHGYVAYIDPQYLQLMERSPAICRKCGKQVMDFSEWKMEDVDDID